MLKLATLILVFSLLSPSFEFDGILTNDVLTIKWGFNTRVSTLDLSNRNILLKEDSALENFNNLDTLDLAFNSIK